MTCSTDSELSLLETLEQRLRTEVSVGVLAEIERELLRLRSELSPLVWKVFCQEFPKRELFSVLKNGVLTRNRLSSANAPESFLNLVLADGFAARPTVAMSPGHIVNAWEYSLPASRSLRARKAYLAREIAEVIRVSTKPRILIVDDGKLPEDALFHSRLDNVQFASVRPDEGICLESVSGMFDLVYSPGWLDSCDDSQAAIWLGAGIEMLRAGGRLLAANFAPGSRDAGWLEACWNWHPHYRSEEHLARLMMEVKSPCLRGHAMFRDESGASVFLEIHSV